jgi:alpha-tubulin suppressor-like RCC1 family protein
MLHSPSFRTIFAALILNVAGLKHFTASAATVDDPRRSVVLIDSALVDRVPEDELAGSEVIAINGDVDVVAQITGALGSLTEIDVLRVVSHGSDGTLWFGKQAFDSSTLRSHSAQVADWRKSLSAGAEILLYGCSVAETGRGRLFVDQLASLTDANVAASTDPTGRGGNTILEYAVGIPAASLMASDSEYERAGIGLGWTTWNHRLTFNGNNQDGTASVTLMFDVDGDYHYSDGTPNGRLDYGPLYLYVNGVRVATKDFSDGKDRFFTGNYALAPGVNVFRVSKWTSSAYWSNDPPATYEVVAPYFYGAPAAATAHTVSVGNSFSYYYYAAGTGPVLFTATGLPAGLAMSSGGVISGYPRSGGAGVYLVNIRASNGFGTRDLPVTFTITNQAPGFASTTPAVLIGGIESTPLTINYALLAATVGATDPNNSIIAAANGWALDPISFRIESVPSGTLTKNGSPVTSGSTSIGAGESLVWTPPDSVNGSLEAFTVRAYDGAHYSATTKSVKVSVGVVNDAPTLTHFSGPITSGNEDSAIPITFAALAAKGDQADIDSTVIGFVVKEVTTGTLRIGTSEATAAPWNASTNKVIAASLNGYWTPAPNANGTQSALKVVARDDGQLESAAPVQAVASVSPVIDAPTLTTIDIISGQTEGTPIEISFTSIAAAADEADVDADIISFRIETVSSGTLQKWNGSTWTAVTPGTTLIAGSDKVLWIPADGSTGLQNAFTLKAWDGQNASANAVQLMIDAALWIIRPWTNEASAGLDPRYLYSHAYSFGATGSFTLGGISFTGISGGNPAVFGKFSTSNFASSVTNDANNLSDASRNLANDFVHGSGDTSAQTIKLSGLTPGGRYVVSLFSVGAEDAARDFTFQSTLGQVAVNQNSYGNNQGIRSDYKYLADANGSATITITPSHGSFNLYGFTNREYVPSIGIYAPASLTYDASAKSFQAHNMAQGASFVSAGVLHSVVLKSDGTVATWGTNDAGQTSVPAGLSDVVAVSAGGYHTLALRSNGTVVAWGSNSSGQTSIPAGLNNAVAISAGKVHNLALKSDGTVVAWGSNFGGQSNVPAGLSGIVAISAGASHSMALRSDGTVVAWGVGFYNYATPPAGLTDVVAISAGEWHSLALKSDGTVVAWGNNGSFQSQVPEGLKGVVAISAGASHSVAVKSDGMVVAWGDRDNHGMTNIPAGLGDVVAIDAGSEHSVALKSDGTVVSFGWFRFGQKFLPTALGPLVGISTGNNHTLALKPDGTVIAWGDNTYGQTSVPNGLAGVVAVQAGDALSVALKSDKTVVAWGGLSSSMPAGLTSVERIAVSARHILALKSNGTVVAWGDNTYGQCNVPGSLTNVTAIAAGLFGSLALKADGTVVFWGNEMSGLSYLPQGLSGVTAISAGTHFGMVLKSDGSVVAWGKPNETYWNPPAGLSGVTAIEAGDGHALALKSDGSVVAWGGNDRGEATVPASVNGVGVIALTAGWQNSIALKSDGTIVAWGNNTSGKNSPSASAQFPPVGIFTRSYDFSTAYSFSYAGRGETPYGPSATAPINAGDYTVTVINTSGTRSISQNFTIQKITPTLSYLNRTNSIPYGTALGSNQVDSVGPYGWNQGTYAAIPGTKVYSPAIGAILPVGTHTLGVTFLPTDSINYNPAVAYAAGTLTVTKTTNASENITLPTLTNLTFNGSAKTHEASAAGVNGFSYTYTGRVGTSYGPSSTAPTYAGSYTVTATVNDPNYTGAKSLDFTIAKATPTITTNPTAAAIAYGQSLASSALTGGVASVPGTFSFATPNTTPGVGTESHTVVFTPADTLNYNTTSGSSSVAVNVASINSSSIVFTPAASLIYNGTAKTFTANAQGIATGFNYSYSGISGTGYGPTSTAPTNAGNYAVTATVTNTNYTGSATQTFTVTKDTPTIAWAAPAGIAYYTALSATQLNATANTAGAFAYMPASGAVLGVGAHVLQTVFTPNDTTNYATVTASVPLQVTSPQLPIALRASPNLTYDGTAKPYVVSQNAYLAAGQEHALALKANGTVLAWGRNNAGQATVPSGLTDVIQVVAGYDFSAAVKANGTVATWGSYIIGDFTNLNLVTNAIAAAAGNAFIAVLRADGTVTSFGGSWSTQTLTVPAGLSGVTAIAAGEDHVLALKADGTVVAWGKNSFGQTTVPAGLSNVVAVAANGKHSLALKADGTVVAWGDNSTGQCNVPADLSGVVEITAGSSSSYALKADGSVVGWGDAYFNVVPTDVTGVAALAAGSQHAFAIKTDGTVAAWGRIKNNSGSDSIDAATFVPSPLSGVGNFSFSYSYASRADTTYPASSSAPTNAGNYTLTVSSTLPNYSYGKTVDFTIAKSTPTITTLPQASIIIEGQTLSASTLKDGVASLSGTFVFTTPSFVPSAGTTLQSITFTPTDSTNHASVTATVTVRSQGGSAATPNIPTLPTAASITFGQRLQDSILSGGAASVPGTFVFSSELTVPNPGTANQSVTFIPTDIVSHAAVTFFVPLTVNDGIVSPLNISLIPPATLDYDGSPKGFHTARGSLLLYGNGYMLVVKSDGMVEAKAPPGWPSLSMPQGLTGVVGVSAGSGSYKALKSDGTIVEWGSTYLQGTAPAGLGGVVAITSGDYHSLALRSNGTVVAWGLNSDGQSDVPAGLLNVVAIAASSNASFALKSNGTVVAWGSNSHGQCDVPVGLSGVIAISAGKNGTVAALKSDRTVECWGRNDSEQATVPAGLKDVVAVSVGHNHTVALKADGTVVAWGMDTVLAFFSNNLVPYNLTDVVAISAGQDKTYALKSDGSVVWWGASANAEQYTANGVMYVVYAVTPLLPADSAGFAFTTTYTGREGTTYASSSTPPTEPGNYSVAVTGTDPDFSATKTIDFTIAKGRPTILSNPFPSGISYGESLASYPLLEGTASVPGTFAFEDPSTIPNAGDSTHNLVFTPADNEHYQPVTVAMEIRVSKATPALVALPTATTLIHGQTLAEATLANGITSVSGTFTFSSTAGVSAGTTRQTVTFTPDDTTNYNAFTTELDVTVELATPSILTSPTASPIAAGQTLTSSTLNGGVASVEGTFTWENSNTAPDTGTTTQNFVFTPNDTTNYNSTSGTVSVTVNKAAPTLTSPPTASAITYGQSLSASTLDGGEASVAGSFAWTNPGTGPNAGTASHAFTFTPDDTTNYQAATGMVDVTVHKAFATVMLGNLKATYNGTPRAASVLTSPEGLTTVITYNGEDTVPSDAGTYELSATIDDANFTGTKSELLTIEPAVIVLRASAKVAATTSISVSKVATRASSVFGNSVTIASVDAASEEGGTVVLTGSSIQYTPAVGFAGVDRFRVTFSTSGGDLVGFVEMTTTGTGSEPSPSSSLGVNPARLTPLSNGRIGVQFNGIPGVAYQLQRSTDLVSWTTVATITAGPRGEISYTDENPPSPSGFYRLFKP